MKSKFEADFEKRDLERKLEFNAWKEAELGKISAKAKDMDEKNFDERQKIFEEISRLQQKERELKQENASKIDALQAVIDNQTRQIELMSKEMVEMKSAERSFDERVAEAVEKYLIWR